MRVNKDNIYLLSPALFAKYTTNNKYKAPRHIRYLEKKILPLLIRGNARIIINMPPRHGKSEYLSKYLPTWHLLNFPEKRIIITSYSADLAKHWSRQIKDLIKIYGKKARGIKLNPANAAVAGFTLKDHTGGVQAVGINGALTGKGADLIILDDPVKNDREANSSKMREKLWEWYKATLYTRLEPGGSIILIMTRWHEDDLCGRIMKQKENECENNDNDNNNNEDSDNGDNTNQWEIIILPAIANARCPLGRKKGEALWAERFNIKKLKELRRTLGEYWFDSLYQQSPYPLAGGIFKVQEFKYFKFNGKDIEVHNSIIPHKENIFIAVDLAASTKESADYTVLMAFAVDSTQNIYILDILRSHFDTLNHLDIIRDLFHQWQPLVVGIESVQYQSAIVRAAAADGIPVKALKPNKDKISRALPMQAKLQSGLVFLPQYAHWSEDFKSELAAFPNGKHDDQVDCFAYINEMISPLSKEFIPTGRKRI